MGRPFQPGNVTQQSGTERAIDMDEGLSPRIQRLKDDIVASIPCEREDARRELANEPISAVLTHYMTWADRFIPQRPRTVTFGADFWSRSLTDRQLEALAKITNISVLGGDLGPYLSSAVLRRGFSGQNAGSMKWVVRDDGHKDFALNHYDLHHLHLSAASGSGKRSGPSNDLLFVRVTRTELRFVLFGDHASFTSEELERIAAKEMADDGLTIVGLTAPRKDVPARERQAMRRAGFTVPATLNRNVVAMPPVAMDGTAGLHRNHVQHTLRFLSAWDNRLDTIEGLDEFAGHCKMRADAFTDLRWGFHYGDLCLQANPSTSVLCFPWRR